MALATLRETVRRRAGRRLALALALLPALAGAEPAPLTPPSPPARPPVAPAEATERPLLLPAAEPAPRRLVGPLLTGVLSLASLGAGAGLLVDVAARYRALDEACQFGCTASQVAPLQQRAVAGYTLLALGGAALALDVVQVALVLRRPAGRTPLRLALAHAPMGISVAGRF